MGEMKPTWRGRLFSSERARQIQATMIENVGEERVCLENEMGVISTSSLKEEEEEEEEEEEDGCRCHAMCESTRRRVRILLLLGGPPSTDTNFS
jgi:hypothetical protein